MPGEYTSQYSVTDWGYYLLQYVKRVQEFIDAFSLISPEDGALV